MHNPEEVKDLPCTMCGKFISSEEFHAQDHDYQYCSPCINKEDYIVDDVLGELNTIEEMIKDVTATYEVYTGEHVPDSENELLTAVKQLNKKIQNERK